VGVPARRLGPPDRQYVGQVAGVEQLHAAELHQFGVAVALLAAFEGRAGRQQLADPREIRRGRPQPVTAEALILVHDRSSLVPASDGERIETVVLPPPSWRA
jgi:hypothetical protein